MQGDGGSLAIGYHGVGAHSQLVILDENVNADNYRKVSNVRRTKYQNLNASRLIL